MNGLKTLPQQADLLNAYLQLQNTKTALNVVLITLYSQWCRFDPRLMEQLIAHFAKHWKELPLFELKNNFRTVPWPSVLGVLLEQTEILVAQGKSEEELTTFKLWKKILMLNIAPAQNELFFIGLSNFAGKMAKQEALFSNKTYNAWGYYGRDILINKWHEKNTTHIKNTSNIFSKDIRKNIAIQLGKQQRRFTISDYLFVCENTISKRQAERDLKSFDFLKIHGNTKARTYLYSP